MRYAIQAQTLTKYYGDFLAVDGISFAVQEGEVFGLLGPNGAGKTTTISMLTGLTRPTSGRMTVAGFDVSRSLLRVKERIGIVSDVASLYDEMSAWDNLIFAARLHDLPRKQRVERVEALLRRFDLYASRRRRLGTFSTGERKRLMIAAALLHEPEILFLDEPTTGLDVQSARQIRELVRHLNSRGVTVLLTTHYIEEADQLCHRIAIINQGELVTIDTPESLKSMIDEQTAVDVCFSQMTAALSRRLEGLEGVERVVLRGTRATLYVQDLSAALSSLAKTARDGGLEIVSLNTSRATLEDAFVALTGVHREAMTSA